MLSFHELYEHYAGDVHRFAYWLAGDANEADDITAETFARAWAAFDTLRMETAKGYLFAIARNLHRESRRRSTRLTLLDQGLPDPGRGPAELSEAAGTVAAVMRALQQLSEGDRAALLMRMHRLPYTEIAHALQISVAAAKVRVHRARLRLAALMHQGAG